MFLDGGNLMHKSGLPAESLQGIMRISLWDDRYVMIENHTGLADMKRECIKVWKDKRLLAINGNELMIEELDGYCLKIKGTILSIEYLT